MALIPVLWQRIEKMVYWFAARYYRLLTAPQCDLDDLKQAGYIGFYHAIEHFNADLSGVKFSTFLWHYLRHAFQDAAGLRHRNDASLRVDCSLDAEIVDDTDLTLRDTIEDPSATAAFNDAERRIFNEQLHEALENVLQQLEADEADVIRKRYFCGLRPSEIGVESDVKNTEHRALRKCRSPKMSKELRRFVDDATPSKIGGKRPTETAAIMREDIAKAGFHSKWLR